MSQLANKITIHHTAGNYQANATDKKAYHYLIDDKGKVTKGIYSIADNMNCQDRKYAAHCGGNNTKNIGVAFCGNRDFSEKTLTSPQPLTRMQLEAGFKLIAELSIKYGIPVTYQGIFTHYEYDQKKKKPEGKIDLIYLPPFPNVERDEIGDFIRSKVCWYISHFDGKFTLV